MTVELAEPISAPARGLVDPEHELLFRLAAIRAVREAEAGRIRELCSHVDAPTLVDLLTRHRLAGVLGTRLIEICGDAVAPEVAEAVSGDAGRLKVAHILMDHRSREFCRRLEVAGIDAVALKGPQLAERIYADPWLRATPCDLDFLVPAEKLQDAVAVFAQMGYSLTDGTIWADGLPHYHFGLQPPEGLPRVELHWRVHWYETTFARRYLEQSACGSDGIRVPAPAYDLAALLTIWARDGFVGLRLAVDIGAWWDAHGAGLAPHALDALIERHPRLRGTLLAAIDAAERVVGLPRRELVSERWRPGWRARVAVGLLNWRGDGDWSAISNDITLIDLLLTPPGAFRVFLRHYYFQPLAHYKMVYGWTDGAGSHGRRFGHAVVRLARAMVRFAHRLWDCRVGGFTALPTRTPS